MQLAWLRDAASGVGGFRVVKTLVVAAAFFCQSVMPCSRAATGTQTASEPTSRFTGKESRFIKSLKFSYCTICRVWMWIGVNCADAHCRSAGLAEMVSALSVAQGRTASIRFGSCQRRARPSHGNSASPSPSLSGAALPAKVGFGKLERRARR